MDRDSKWVPGVFQLDQDWGRQITGSGRGQGQERFYRGQALSHLADHPGMEAGAMGERERSRWGKGWWSGKNWPQHPTGLVGRDMLFGMAHTSLSLNS